MCVCSCPDEHQVASRFLAIWAAGRLRGETLIFLCFSLAATSIALGFVVLPYLFAGAPPQWILWAATACYGFGCGPIFGACNSLPAQHGARVTGAQMTLLQLGVSCGNTVGPFVASRAFKVEALGVSCCKPIACSPPSQCVHAFPALVGPILTAVRAGWCFRASVAYLMLCSQPCASGYWPYSLWGGCSRMGNCVHTMLGQSKCSRITTSREQPCGPLPHLTATAAT